MGLRSQASTQWAGPSPRRNPASFPCTIRCHESSPHLGATVPWHVGSLLFGAKVPSEHQAGRTISKEEPCKQALTTTSPWATPKTHGEKPTEKNAWRKKTHGQKCMRDTHGHSYLLLTRTHTQPSKPSHTLSCTLTHFLMHAPSQAPTLPGTHPPTTHFLPHSLTYMHPQNYQPNKQEHVQN